VDRCISLESSDCGAVWSDPIFNASNSHRPLQLASSQVHAELYPSVLATCLRTHSTALTTRSFSSHLSVLGYTSSPQLISNQPPTQCLLHTLGTAGRGSSCSSRDGRASTGTHQAWHPERTRSDARYEYISLNYQLVSPEKPR
jgi:hypothetical protein